MRSLSRRIALLGFLSGSLTWVPNPVVAAPSVLSTYLVTFTDGSNARAEAARLSAQNFGVTYVYENLFQGVAVQLPEAAAQALAKNPRVARIAPDAAVTVTDTQSNATWGLDRVDQRLRPLDTKFNYPTSAGTGVNAYIVDTGILGGHNEFSGGRIKSGYTAINDGRGTTDCNGHGTHVAGTVAGTTWGVAKKASLIPVRVLGCTGSGTWAGVIAGLDWVAKNHVDPAVANLSLGGPKDTTVNDAIQRLVDSGVTVVVAAGNESADACTRSPASAPAAITVGATNSSDTRSSFSNFGSCVDIFAPGESITSAWYTSNSATTTISGTSMASPHVAGAAALLLGLNGSKTPAHVAADLIANATTGLVSSAGTNSPNLLLHSNFVNPPLQSLAVSPSVLPSARVGTNYSATVTASGGTGPYSWTMTGLENSGLSFANGIISGVPTTATTYALSVTITDSANPPASITTPLTLTVSPPLVLPSAFSKLSPVNGATGISRTSAVLTWASSTNATSYEMCISTSTTCSNWTRVTNLTTTTVSSLKSRTTYYWQVRARTTDGTILANSGTSWRFTTMR